MVAALNGEPFAFVRPKHNYLYLEVMACSPYERRVLSVPAIIFFLALIIDIITEHTSIVYRCKNALSYYKWKTYYFQFFHARSKSIHQKVTVRVGCSDHCSIGRPFGVKNCTISLSLDKILKTSHWFCI